MAGERTDSTVQMLQVQEEMKAQLQKDKEAKEQEEKASIAALLKAKNDKELSDAYANFTAKLAKRNQVYLHGNDKPSTLWDAAMQKAADAMNAEVTTYNDWRNAMMSLLGMLVSLNKALNHAVTDKTSGIVFPLGYKIKQKIRDGFGAAFKGVKGLFTSEKENEPALDYHVAVNRDGELDVKLSQKDKDLPAIASIFKKGIELWLKDQGYRPVKVNVDGKELAQFVNADGEKLTNEKLDQLNANPETSLQACLEKHFNAFSLQAKPEPEEPEPSAAPRLG